jgi:hypothetical protein
MGIFKKKDNKPEAKSLGKMLSLQLQCTCLTELAWHEVSNNTASDSKTPPPGTKVTTTTVTTTSKRKLVLLSSILISSL